jgi:hypothetical protein
VKIDEDARKLKELKEKSGFADVRELVAWATGRLTLAIGEGTFRSEVHNIMTTAMYFGQYYDKVYGIKR